MGDTSASGFYIGSCSGPRYGQSISDSKTTSGSETTESSHEAAHVTSPFAKTEADKSSHKSQNLFNYNEDGAIANIMDLFSSYRSGNMPQSQQDQLIDKNYNTISNLHALQEVYNPKVGNALANMAEKIARGKNGFGDCAKYVNNAVEACGITNKGETRDDAYKTADKFAAAKDKFAEITDQLSLSDLDKLPAGCIVVWSQYTDKCGKFHKNGHVAVTLGDGSAACDHYEPKMYKPNNATFRVFVAKGTLNQTA